MRVGRVAIASFVVASCASFSASTTDAPSPDAGGAEGGAPDVASDAAAKGYAELVLAAKPVGYYRFEETEGSGGLRDEVTGTNIGTVHGVPTFGETGVAGGHSVRFEPNTKDWVELGDRYGFAGTTDAGTPQPFTIEVWLAPAPNQGLVHAVTKQRRDNPKEGWAVYVNDNFVVERYAGSQGLYSDYPDAAVTDAFTHVAAVYTGTTLLLYVDGKPYDAKDDTRILTAEPATPAFIAAAGPDENLYAGRIDELALYDRVLDSKTIAAHAAAGR